MWRYLTCPKKKSMQKRSFPKLKRLDAHHSLSHHQSDPQKLEKIAKIDQFYLRQFGYFLDKMKTLKEGENTLLDNSMVLLGNGNGDAARHDHYNCMTVLAGRGCGTIDPGTPGGVVHHCSIALAAMGIGSIAAVPDHTAGARDGEHTRERIDPNSDDLGCSSAGDSGAGIC